MDPKTTTKLRRLKSSAIYVKEFLQDFEEWLKESRDFDANQVRIIDEIHLEFELTTLQYIRISPILITIASEETAFSVSHRIKSASEKDLPENKFTPHAYTIRMQRIEGKTKGWDKIYNVSMDFGVNGKPACKDDYVFDFIIDEIVGRM